MLEGPEVPATDTETPSQKRLGTEKRGLEVLLTDPRMHNVDLPTKKEILRLLYVSGAFKPQSFDAVMTSEPVPQLTADTVAEHIENLKLVEMKTTQAPIRDAALGGFFFGATDNEFQMAKALKDRYLFAFVVLGSDNDYGRPFFVLLTLEQLHARTRTSRIQYQINFRTDMTFDETLFPNSGLGPDLDQMPTTGSSDGGDLDKS